MRRGLLSVAALVLAAAACGEDTPGPDEFEPNPTTGERFAVTWGPFTIAAGEEDTRCVEKRLTNAEAKWIAKIHTRLTGASHHLIVYRMPGTEERPEPYPCLPFIDTLRPESEGAPLMVSQIPQETLELPRGVAFDVAPQQLVRLEMHYLNASDAPMEVTAEAIFEVLPPEELRHEADFLFIGNPDIRLPPGPSTLGPTPFEMPEELADVKIFAMTGHTHQWGTNVVVEHVPQKYADPVPVYDYPNWSWKEPPVARYWPPLDMPRGAGFQFTCSWDNRSGKTVEFGESTEDEMCFFWSYYYPSKGHKVCIHTDQVGSLDVCCPGNSLCDLIPTAR